MRKELLFLVILGAMLHACAPDSAHDVASPSETASTASVPLVSSAMSQVVDEIESLDRMRSSLADGLVGYTGEIDTTIFARVCKPVGKRAMEIGAANGWNVRQIAVKNRNPKNTADDDLAEIHLLFEERPELKALWLQTDAENDSHANRYVRRIDVETACLACHGSPDDVPDFVNMRYPEDRAVNFQSGDLRGLYVVDIPSDLR